MIKTDKSIHNICVASIKRATIKPYDFKWTKFYESNSDFQNAGLELDLAKFEQMICSTIIDKDNFSILTTRQLLTNQNGLLVSGNIQGATDKQHEEFRSYIDEAVTLGQVQLQEGSFLQYFIETGRASMVMIYGVGTLIRIT